MGLCWFFRCWKHRCCMDELITMTIPCTVRWKILIHSKYAFLTSNGVFFFSRGVENVFCCVRQQAGTTHVTDCIEYMGRMRVYYLRCNNQSVCKSTNWVSDPWHDASVDILSTISGKFCFFIFFWWRPFFYFDVFAQTDKQVDCQNFLLWSTNVCESFFYVFGGACCRCCDEAVLRVVTEFGLPNPINTFIHNTKYMALTAR